MLLFIASLLPAVLISASIAAQVPGRMGQGLALAVGALLAAGAAGVLLGGFSIPGILGAVIGAVAGLYLARPDNRD